MALGGEAGQDGSGNRAFRQHGFTLRKEAGKIQGGLRVHAIDIAVHHHIDLAHGLEITAHDAKTHVDLAVFPGHGGNEGVQADAWRGRCNWDGLLA